jgi:hypothetical protein
MDQTVTQRITTARTYLNATRAGGVFDADEGPKPS